MNIPDHISESLETIFWGKIPVPVLKFFDADAAQGLGLFQIRDPGWKKFGSGYTFRIRNTGW